MATVSIHEFDPEVPAHEGEVDAEEYNPAPPSAGFETDPVDHFEQADEIELDEPQP